ncbi:ribosomal subunit 39S-domain-containing protein [Hypomontagnella monticulosa]|nr:ribosomal subunit 39S-domain-containing protein [Hypomontagnella monticulosa]
MRRILRLRRPSNLSTSTSRSSVAPLVGQCPPTSQIIQASRRRPIPTSYQHPTPLRLYSTDKQLTPQDPTQNIETAKVDELSESAEEDVEGEEFQFSQEWEAYMPPPQRSYAERADEVSDPSYVPALAANGLETVGGLKDWWDKQEHWPQSADFASFKPLEKVVDPAVLETSVRRAVVEAFALRQAGREDELVAAWPVAGEEALRHLMAIDVKVTEDGAVSFSGDVPAVLESLNWNRAEESESEIIPDVSILSTEEAQKYKESWSQDWKAASLSDPRIKFAIIKRIFQLTGQLVHDHQLSGITDVRSLLRAVQKSPKPKTLTQEIQERRQDLIQLPNVSVATKRITRGDREKALGRFKLIEEEFRKRELPLEGHGFVEKNKELARLKGGV